MEIHGFQILCIILTPQVGQMYIRRWATDCLPIYSYVLMSDGLLRFWTYTDFEFFCFCFVEGNTGSWWCSTILWPSEAFPRLGLWSKTYWRSLFSLFQLEWQRLSTWGIIIFFATCWVSTLAYPNLLGTKRLCCCCCYSNACFLQNNFKCRFSKADFDSRLAAIFIS